MRRRNRPTRELSREARENISAAGIQRQAELAREQGPLHPLKEKRTSLGFSQRELAEAAICDPQTVAKIEQGRLSPSGIMQKRIARALEVLSKRAKRR